MNIYYLVTSRSGGTIYHTFDNKQEAYDKRDQLNTLQQNAVMCEYVRTPKFVFSRPLKENITSASCGCVMSKEFHYIDRIPLADFEAYATQKTQYTKEPQDLIF